MAGFKDVIGRKELIGYMQKAVEQGSVSHAYILCGERGAGKKLLAKLFAMALQCESGTSDSCNECHSCKQMLSNNHPDIIQVTHEKPTTISIDDIREQVNQDVMIRPYSSKYKIYIIPEADMMTVQAQNAILKTLEEPPEYAIFFLLVENTQKLLPTIHSRCVMLRLRNVKDSLIQHYLVEQMEVPDYKALVCTAFAQGNLGKAIMLATSEHFAEVKEDAIKLLRHVGDMGVEEIIVAMQAITKYKLEITDYLDILMIWYRDVLLYKATKDIDKVIFADQMDYIKEQAKRSSYEGIEIILKSMETAKARIRANVNFDLVMELLLLTIKENAK
jgi:DNA polymerase III, delta'' subunit